ncbi:MAG TPA: sigma-54-dependent Fis family transcriptional regulator [Betaproteobacteria bacterium]|nr:sigma-54-dependent Fis family transcriptional regulator [Betaproteobacteria bacterium]
MSSILVVDDEAGIRELLLEILQDEGHRVMLAENAAEARVWREREKPALVLLDIWMPDTDGITLLKEWKGLGALTMPVVMMSGHGSIDTAVEATKIGAFDFLEKPITLQKLLNTVHRALLRSEAQQLPEIDLSCLGKGERIDALRQRLIQVAQTQTPVLLMSEPGAGAELCARFFLPAGAPWVALSETKRLADDPLQIAEQARGGVLFLEDVQTLNKLEQKGLLVLLNKGEKYRLRVVCTIDAPLGGRVEGECFDPGLFNALSGVTLTVPPLRAHAEDIPELAKRLLAQHVERQAAPMRDFGTAALNALRQAEWPGNLAQLENAVKTLALTSLEEEISADDVNRVLHQFAAPGPAVGAELPLEAPLREAREAFERVYFEYHIRKAAGNMSRVAEQVGLERTHLYRKLKQLGITFARKTGEG